VIGGEHDGPLSNQPGNRAPGADEDELCRPRMSQHPEHSRRTSWAMIYRLAMCGSTPQFSEARSLEVWTASARPALAGSQLILVWGDITEGHIQGSVVLL